jgi:hypothetical protein
MRTGPAAIGRAAPPVRQWSGITTARDCAKTPHQNRGIHRIHRVGLGGCGENDLRSTEGIGLFYCFAAN